MSDFTMTYDFEWDPIKKERNLIKHGVAFEEAATVFLDPDALSELDSKHGGFEERWITMGFSTGGRLLVVCHTFDEVGRRRCRIRLISSRRAARKERQSYGK